jgi:hypothetical protein
MIILGNILLFGCLFMCSQNSATVVGAPVYAGGLSVRWGSGSHGTDAVSAVGAAVSLVDLFSIYNCPATNITAVNAIANIALANCGTSSILYFYLLQTGGRPRERVIQTRRGESTAQTLAQCDSEQAGAKQDKTGNDHSEETVRSEFFTHGTPPTARASGCQQDQLHTFAIVADCHLQPTLPDWQRD